jgi:hypothetical protein
MKMQGNLTPPKAHKTSINESKDTKGLKCQAKDSKICFKND